MSSGNLELKNNVIQKKRYKYVAPDGGWGYMVTAAVSLTFIATVVPLCVFGIVYGNFLSGIGDETYGTTLANGIFNTVLSFTGLPANMLLQTYTCRKVGLLGAVLFFIGNFGIVFATNLFQLLLTFGILQGVGFGLMMPSVFTAFHQYFDLRKNVIMGLCQASIVAVTIGFPIFTKILLDEYGWRGTVLIFSGLSLHCIVAMLTFQPVKWHMKKVEITEIELQQVDNSKATKEKEPLLLNKQHENVQHQDVKIPKHQRPSIVSIGSMALSSEHINRVHKTPEEQNKGCCTTISESLDLGLFKDPIYVNIAFGLSLSLTSDLAFLSLLPLILVNAGFSAANVTTIMTIYFISDLVSRLFLSFLSVVYNVRNRYVFLIGSVLSAFFRTTLMLNSTSFYWICGNCVALGFLRCFIQTPLPLVVAEQYGNRFTTAFSLYMVVCGVVSLIFGPLIGFVKAVTGSDTMVVHLLTLAYLLCAVPWTVELLGKKLMRSNSKQEIDEETTPEKS